MDFCTLVLVLEPKGLVLSYLCGSNIIQGKIVFDQCHSDRFLQVRTFPHAATGAEEAKHASMRMYRPVRAFCFCASFALSAALLPLFDFGAIR